MDIKDALKAFESLSQETRLRTFRLLIEHGMDGAPAGTISEALGIPHNTLSFHLAHMSKARLITSRKQGRSVIYSVNFVVFQDLILFMIEDCCSKDMANVRQNKKTGQTLIELSNLAGCCG